MESVAIILSILLAFAIDAGWDAIKERSQEKAFLVSLLSDFKEARNRINKSTDRHKRYIDSARQLLELQTGDVANIESETLENLLGAVFFDWTSLFLPSGSRDALFASGDIEIIENEELRAMLAAWPSFVADAAEDESLITNHVMNNLAPYLQGKIQTRNIVRTTNSDVADLIPRIETPNYDAIWNDPMFESHLTFRIANEAFAVDENESLSEVVSEITQVIEEELNR